MDRTFHRRLYVSKSLTHLVEARTMIHWYSRMPAVSENWVRQIWTRKDAMAAASVLSTPDLFGTASAIASLVAEGPRLERRRNWDSKAKDRLEELERKWQERRAEIIQVIREQLWDGRSETVQPRRKPSRKAADASISPQASHRCGH